jgi:hypothetical protein
VLDFVKVTLNIPTLPTAEPAFLPILESGSRASAKAPWFANLTRGTKLGTPPSQNFMGVGSHSFATETVATVTAIAATNPGTRHHAQMLGFVSARRTAVPTRIQAELYAIDQSVPVGWPIDTSEQADETIRPAFGDTRVGDLIPYAAIGYFASHISGNIIGEQTFNVQQTTKSVKLLHAVRQTVTGGAPAPVTGTVAVNAAPALVAPWTFGKIWSVSVTGYASAPNPAKLPATNPRTPAGVVQDLQGVSLVSTTVGMGGPINTFGPVRLAVQYQYCPVEMDDESGGKTADVIVNAAMPYTIQGDVSNTFTNTWPAGVTPLPYLNNLVLAGDLRGNVVGPAGNSQSSSFPTPPGIGWRSLVSPPGVLSARTTVTPTSYASFLATKTPTWSDSTFTPNLPIWPGSTPGNNFGVYVETEVYDEWPVIPPVAGLHDVDAKLIATKSPMHPREEIVVGVTNPGLPLFMGASFQISSERYYFPGALVGPANTYGNMRGTGGGFIYLWKPPPAGPGIPPVGIAGNRRSDLGMIITAVLEIGPASVRTAPVVIP